MKIKSAHVFLIGLVMSSLYSAGCAITSGAAFTMGDRLEYHYVDTVDEKNYFISATNQWEYEVIDVAKEMKAGKMGRTEVAERLVGNLAESLYDDLYDSLTESQIDDGVFDAMWANALVSTLIVSDKSNSSMPGILVKYPADLRGYESPYIIWDGRNTNGDKTNSTLEAGNIPWIYYKAIAVGLNQKGFNIVRLTPDPLKSKDFSVQLQYHDFENILKNATPDYILEVNILETKRHFLRESVWDIPRQDFELTTELKIYDGQSKKLISESIVKSIKPDVAGDYIPKMFMSVLKNHFSEVINHSIFKSLEKTSQN